MTLIKKTVTGMRDILPDEMEIRRYCIGVIREIYARYGFTEIETPVVESLENLVSDQGGDNEKLIFRILKRGEKLKLDGAKSAEDVTDAGLRYDLTVPLVRYYANHMNELPNPFKALQMGNVFRADRPQKGRFRQFMQCDIDILGEPGIIAEIELILALTGVLGKLGFSDFEIRISDRRLLHAMAAYCGFPEDAHDSVFITLDKLDKIGAEGVEKELTENGFAPEAVGKCLALFTGSGKATDAGTSLALLKSFCETVGTDECAAVLESLTGIIESVDAAKEASFRMVFDPTLVRGMGYYTGTIFEVSMPQFNASCGGGGRYDKMIGRFGCPETPAVGFSIGFERIIMLLMENGFRIPDAPGRVAYLIEKGTDGERLTRIIKEAADECAAGAQVLVVHMNKNKKFQKEQLSAQGYTGIREFYRK
ncbi:MAG: histidine--tRNA ligase [Lachnospiraceae bacterium]|nr:histidine--tRNA ligase [Lachnospiraceae bacterium]